MYKLNKIPIKLDKVIKRINNNNNFSAIKSVPNNEINVRFQGYHSSLSQLNELKVKPEIKKVEPIDFYATTDKSKGTKKENMKPKSSTINKVPQNNKPEDFSFPSNNPNTVTTKQISEFLSNMGQISVQNSEKYFLVTCPNCHNDSSISATKTFLKPDHGNYFCYSCRTHGNWEQFKMLTKENRTKLKKPPSIPNNLGQLVVPELLQFEYKDIEENKFIYNILCGENSPLDEKTLKDYWISFSNFEASHDPAKVSKKEKVPCAIFPRTSLSSSDENENQYKIVSFKASTFPTEKFVTFEPKTKSEPGFFGYHLISNECEEICLTPTEADAMSVYQATNIPSVSLPKNIYQLPIEYMPLLARFKRIYLWFDGDVQGQNAAQLFARKLGFDRCYLVKNEAANSEKVRSAYDCLAKGYNLKEFIKESKLITHSKVVDFEKLKDSVLLEIMYADQVKGIPTKNFPSLNQIIKGFRPGELTIFSGPTGMGKTTFLSQLSLDFCSSGVSTMWGSFEISNTRLAKKMLFQYAGKTIGTEVEEYNHWAEKFQQLPLYFMKFFGSTKVKEVIDAMEHAVYAHDVQHILIDNLQFMTSGLGKGFERYEIQEDALSVFRKFATEYNVHITLVVHPRKDDREFLDVGSIFGSAKITQEADNVMILQNAPNDLRYIDVKKNRFDGTTGMVPLKFDKESNRSIELTPEEINELDKLLKSHKN
ncbi:P-loop containing nucleoside triphosphate hydrolase protein [Neoconidiobolus thromboides FSU 785]|nr:P-loop containing nucleoside triphosphate hydrolase protein [Neoconidiobolus thromboides FSU 785]